MYKCCCCWKTDWNSDWSFDKISMKILIYLNNKKTMLKIDIFKEKSNELEKTYEEMHKKQQEEIEKYFTKILWNFSKIPKFILKRLYHFESSIHYNFWGWKTVYKIKNRLTKKESILIVEFWISNKK